MFCHNCGTQLPEIARFCIQCGAPVNPPSEEPEADKPEELTPTPTAEAPEAVRPEEPALTPAAEEPEADKPETSGLTELPVAETHAAPPEKLVLRKKKITATEQELSIFGKYYIRKPGKRRFKKKKGPVTIPLTSVKETETLRSRPAGGLLASFLLLLIFTVGFLISGWFEINTWQEYNMPYREEDLSLLEASLAEIDNASEGLPDLEKQLASALSETEALETMLTEYNELRETEIQNTVTDAVNLNYEALFSNQFFTSAYKQYINDLLNAFKQDEAIDSWLYTYYAYSSEYGANRYLDYDLWIYATKKEEAKFSDLLENCEVFCTERYTYDISEHLSRNNQLYISGLDMLNILFDLPGYILDDAIFIKAYGGNPDPEEMEVPGWTVQDYNDFWSNASARVYSDTAIWEDYNLSAEDFDIDWNTLFDEEAYYSAYVKFMDTIAPGLGRSEMAEYMPDDAYFGGVCYQYTVSEPSLKEIADAYIASNPTALEELGINPETMASSYDKKIADTEAQLETLKETLDALTLEKSDAEKLLINESSLRERYQSLLIERERYTTRLINNLWIFGFILCFLLIMIIISLCRFISFLKKPRRMLVLKQEGTETSFSLYRCSKDAVEAFQKQFNKENK